MLHVPLMFVRMAWISLGALPCRKKKTWQLASGSSWNVARRLTCFLSASVTRKDLQFGTGTTSLANDTIDSVLRHREVCRAKDLSAPPRMFFVSYVIHEVWSCEFVAWFCCRYFWLFAAWRERSPWAARCTRHSKVVSLFETCVE